MLDLADKKVVHETFGEGNIIDNSEGYIKVDFESGVKRFIFPDVFGEFMTFTDEKMAGFIKEELKEKEEELKIEAIRLEEEREKERERQRILELQKKMKNRKVHSELQSVFWVEGEAVDKIFEEGRVFVGRFKSGKKEGQPRRLARMNGNSGCLITKRNDDILEKNRTILGLFMAEEGFDGRSAEDGYIPAHSEYRLRLSEEESEKMLFWKYYKNKRSPKDIVWKSGRQRYFDNIWMAQILRDIISLREGTKEQKSVKDFFSHFCRINLIDVDRLPEADGALIQP